MNRNNDEIVQNNDLWGLKAITEDTFFTQYLIYVCVNLLKHPNVMSH